MKRTETDIIHPSLFKGDKFLHNIFDVSSVKYLFHSMMGDHIKYISAGAKLIIFLLNIIYILMRGYEKILSYNKFGNKLIIRQAKDKRLKANGWNRGT